MLESDQLVECPVPVPASVEDDPPLDTDLALVGDPKIITFGTEVLENR